jgi:hypothetical protein
LKIFTHHKNQIFHSNANDVHHLNIANV